MSVCRSQDDLFAGEGRQSAAISCECDVTTRSSDYSEKTSRTCQTLLISDRFDVQPAERQQYTLSERGPPILCKGHFFHAFLHDSLRRPGPDFPRWTPSRSQQMVPGIMHRATWGVTFSAMCLLPRSSRRCRDGSTETTRSLDYPHISSYF